MMLKVSCLPLFLESADTPNPAGSSIRLGTDSKKVKVFSYQLPQITPWSHVGLDAILSQDTVVTMNLAIK